MGSQELQRIMERLIERVDEALTPYDPEKVILFGSWSASPRLSRRFGILKRAWV